MQAQVVAHLEDQYVKNVYNQIAHYFDNTRGYTWSWIREFVNSHVKPGDVVYDIGCGNGRNMAFRKDVTFIGLDNCQEFTDICYKKGLNAVIGDMCEMPFETNTANAVICIASFHHLINPQRRRQALYELKRVCKPRGKILLSVWSINQPKKTRRIFTKYGDTIVKWNQNGVIYDRYYYIFRIKEINDLFEECGLEVVSHTYDCGNEVFILEA